MHTPFSVRGLACEVMAASLDDALSGSVVANMLEEARPKLIYTQVPKDASTAAELKRRLTMWKEGQFEELLARIESQSFAVFESRRRKRGPTPVSEQGKQARAQRLAADGALSKAVQSLGESPPTLSPAEQRSWADTLLPLSRFPQDAICSSPTGNSATAEEQQQQPVYGTDASQHPLKGIRFAALSAPGPSGARPEHIKEALQAKSRVLTGKLLKAIGRLERMAVAGKLPDSMRWITRSRLIFLKKATGNKPRPIRIGELLRRIIGKHMAHGHRSEFSAVFGSMRQWGVGTPGGCEGLVHFRQLIEQAATDGAIDPVVCLDLDLENCFCTVEWHQMRLDVASRVPTLLPWLQWAHGAAAEVVLPSQAEVHIDRGAEQGEPLVSAYASVGIGGGVC